MGRKLMLTYFVTTIFSSALTGLAAWDLDFKILNMIEKGLNVLWH